jgi:hypothetical protein
MQTDEGIGGISGLFYAFYFIWPLIVVIYSYWKNSLLIQKKLSLILVSLLANYLLFIPVIIWLTILSWMFLSAMLTYSLLGKIVFSVIATIIYIFSLFIHVFLTKNIVKIYV